MNLIFLHINQLQFLPFGNNNDSVLSSIILLPFFSFVVLGLWGKKLFKTSAGALATLILTVATVLSFYVAYQYFFIDGKVNGVYEKVVALQFTWLQFSKDLVIHIGIVLDPISILMLVIVTFISLMVHLFSISYLKGEERFATYYAYLSLFTFSMLGLVVATNIFQMYIFWELVGVSSFLLIGFYYQKPSAVAAAKKAFIVTRFADLGFLIGILILSFHTHTLDFNLIIERLTNTQSPEFLDIASVSFLGISGLTWGLCLVFVGGAGKSAMFPLHIWLPDAMEGPTPVSALIHAATMVVAGVYLVARLFPVFSMDQTALHLIMYTGALSAFFAAIIACTQTDIKRVLAYSTMSQIGYMILSLGVAIYGGENGLGYMAAMFHLFTHAFFKSLLFLAAGVIIHAVHSNEMNDMGGLRKLMPLTHIVFLVACLAISGIPPFAGFFSKEEILLAAFQSNKIIYCIALITASLTAFYMFRLYFVIFWNKPFVNHSNEHYHLHMDVSWQMKMPLIILGLSSVFAGFVPFATLITSDGISLHTSSEITFSILPVLLAVTSIAVAAILYKSENDKAVRITNTIGGLYRAAYKKFYIDEIYIFITHRILFNVIGKAAAWVDKYVVDELMNLLGALTIFISESIKKMQSGKVQQYALYFYGGVIGLAILFLYLLT